MNRMIATLLAATALVLLPNVADARPPSHISRCTVDYKCQPPPPCVEKHSICYFI